MGRILVLGSSGFLGRAICQIIKASSDSLFDYSRTASSELHKMDVRDVDAIQSCLLRIRPRWVIYCAAIADVDMCQHNPRLSRQINLVKPIELARLCSNLESRVVFFSTDYVFAGEKGPYREDDPVAPINVYGQHKAEAEAGVLAADSKNLVIRTSLLFEHPRSTEGLIARTREHYIKHGKIYASTNQYNSPTFVEDLAKTTYKLMKAEKSGIYHLAGPQTLSRFEIVRRILEPLGGAPTPSFTSPSIKPDGSAPRPLSCGLIIRRAQEAIGYTPSSLASILDNA